MMMIMMMMMMMHLVFIFFASPKTKIHSLKRIDQNTPEKRQRK